MLKNAFYDNSCVSYSILVSFLGHLLPALTWCFVRHNFVHVGHIASFIFVGLIFVGFIFCGSLHPTKIKSIENLTNESFIVPMKICMSTVCITVHYMELVILSKRTNSIETKQRE